MTGDPSISGDRRLAIARQIDQKRQAELAGGLRLKSG
jgi:hypothetical protein